MTRIIPIMFLNILVFGADLQVGSIAPGFELRDQDGVLHRLDDYKGKKLVVYFFPKADTPG